MTASAGPEIGSVERVVAMRALPGGAELHANELSVLASIARPRRLAKGEALTQEGAALHAIFAVLEGEVSVRRGGQLLARAGQGSVIGALQVFARDPRGLDCRAVEGAVVLQLAADDLEDVFEELPTVLVHVLRHVARRALALDLLRDGARPSPHPLPSPVAERPLDLVERILSLHRCAAFVGVTIDAIAALANVAHELRASQGEQVWRAGERPSSLLMIVRGELVVSIGARTVTLRAGDLAGEFEVLAGEPHPSEAVARGALVALAIDRDALLDSWEDHTDLGVELLRDVSALLLDSRAEGT